MFSPFSFVDIGKEKVTGFVKSKVFFWMLMGVTCDF